MFFDAMSRKNFEPQATDMKSIVPIHNAVNERAWSLIKRWEEPYDAESRSCGGPKLLSFKGLGAPQGNDGTWAGWLTMMSDGTVTPRAKWKVVVEGKKAPFDRHDWVVDRCGKRVEYVIDFYEGKGGGLLNFYLDVRPKLNSWEGWKMRAWRAFGDR